MKMIETQMTSMRWLVTLPLQIILIFLQGQQGLQDQGDLTFPDHTDNHILRDTSQAIETLIFH